MKQFSFQTRHENINKLNEEVFDILIIGGGITGAGVARDAALRGLKVALIEAHDFASGTSSRSSKLVHGGIRYLENLEFKLVFEALSERAKLFKIAPHLVHPLRFMIPIYQNSRVGLFKMSLGMWLYDILALFRTPKMHETVFAKNTLKRMPILKSEGLKGSTVYSDAYMDDDRLVIETLRSANEANACIVNYVSATAIDLKNEIKVIQATDHKDNKFVTIKARHIVSAVGPWSDMLGLKLSQNWKNILRPTKGIHLTFKKEKLNLTSAVVMAAQESNRIVFAIPRHEMIIVGTTDTDFKGDPADVKTDKADIEYLLKITNEYFPNANLTVKDIVASYAGVRPLVKDESDNEGKTSREHTIILNPEGYTLVAGGKYTTYRLMAEQIVDKVIHFLKLHSVKKCQTSEPLNPYVDTKTYENSLKSIGTETENKLVKRYGAEAFVISENFHSKNHSYWQLEAMQAIQNGMCLSLLDFYSRRIPLILSEVDHGLSHLESIATVFQNQLHLSENEIAAQKSELQDYINSEFSWKKLF